MKNSILTVQNFVKERLRANSYQKEDFLPYKRYFQKIYIRGIFLSAGINTDTILKNLAEWKLELGDEAWNHVYVLFYNISDPPTADLTLNTNALALITASTLSSLEKLYFAPSVSDSDEGLLLLGKNILRPHFANFLFPDSWSKKHSIGIYSDLIDITHDDDLEVVKEILNRLENKP